MAKIKKPVIIEVHTEVFELESKRGIKNWELSTVIANKIETFLIQNSSTITKENIDNNTPVNYALIADDTKITDLTDADLTNAIYVARYKIIYEYMEATERNGILSSEDAWGITYSDTGIPSKIE